MLLDWEVEKSMLNLEKLAFWGEGVINTTEHKPIDHLTTNSNHSKHVLQFIILENFNNHFFILEIWCTI